MRLVALGPMALALLAQPSCGEAYAEGPGNGPAHAVFDAKPIDFGVVGCGAAAPGDQKITLSNDGGAALTWSASLEDTSQFSIRGAASGTIASNASADITIGSLPIAATEAAGTTKQTILTITTNDERAPSISAPVHITAGGGALEIVPQTLSFGEAPVSVPTLDVPISIRNSGSLPVTVSIDQPQNPQFSIAGIAGPTLLAPDATIPNLVGKFTPNARGDQSTTAAIKIDGPVCGAPPPAITLNGTGASGTVAVQPSLVDFGSVACNSTPAAKTVMLLNVGTDPFTYQALLGKGVASAFTVTPSNGGTVAPASSATITITPQVVPANGVGDNLYGDVLNITTNAMSDKPHPVTLRLTPSGAIITASPSSINFGNVNTGGPGATRSVTLKNDGNYPTTVYLSTTGPDAFDALTPSVTLQAGASGSATVRCKPGGNGAKVGTLTFFVFTSSRLCRPLPAPIKLDCRGV